MSAYSAASHGNSAPAFPENGRFPYPPVPARKRKKLRATVVNIWT